MVQRRTDPKSEVSRSKSRWWLILSTAVLLLLTFLMFADVLFSSSRILSHGYCDLRYQFLPWRDFGFRELRHGHLALWNPHVYGGEPFLGNFQSALFYPFNWVYLVLPLGLATNWYIAAHVFLGGFFTWLWTWRRGLHPVACLMAAAVLMFCGPSFWHIFAGHVTNLGAMIWFPLVLLSIDELFASAGWGWCLIGMFALVMQIFAGNPQYVYYTVLAAGIYSGFQLFGAKRKAAVLAGWACILVGGAMLAAVQLLPGWEASRDSVRSSGLSYADAAMVSFPPENLLTLVAPTFFGDNAHAAYWGRSYIWEASLFVGVAGLILVIYGVVRGGRPMRRIYLPTVLLLVVLSLGDHTPLFRLLYYGLPGFGNFRGTAKFAYFAAVFMAMLAGTGMEQLIRRPGGERRMAAIILAVAVLLGIGSAVLHWEARGDGPAIWWAGIVRSVVSTNETYVRPETVEQAVLVWQRLAAVSLAVSAGTLLALGALLAMARRFRWTPYAIAALAVAEVFAFAANSRDTFDMATFETPGLRDFFDAHPGDYRILNFLRPNEAMVLRAYDLWGAYDPMMPLRYAEFVGHSQGQTKADPYVQFRDVHHRFLDMLRLRYVFFQTHGEQKVERRTDAFPHVLVVQDYRVVRGRDAIFAAMEKPDFDARKTVLLEEPPEVEPDGAAAPGTAEVVDASADCLTIKASLKTAGVLLITDAWNKGW
ncbi:MAG: YfhO family protein, partial [Planctomycetaceae bacterium]|nr:YfhO family protein [Planctomycetaceae bacterium]